MVKQVVPVETMLQYRDQVFAQTSESGVWSAPVVHDPIGLRPGPIDVRETVKSQSASATPLTFAAATDAASKEAGEGTKPVISSNAENADKYTEALINLRALQSDVKERAEDAERHDWVAGSIGGPFGFEHPYDWRPTIASLKTQISDLDTQFDTAMAQAATLFNNPDDGAKNLVAIQKALAQLATKLAIMDAYIRLIQADEVAISSPQVVGETGFHNHVIDFAKHKKGSELFMAGA